MVNINQFWKRKDDRFDSNIYEFTKKKQLLDVNLKHYTLDEKRYESKIITVFEMKNHQSKLIGETCIYIYISATIYTTKICHRAAWKRMRREYLSE